MADQHLSELCRGTDVGYIYSRLKQLVAEPEEPADSALVMYLSGIWGYRDADGRTAFHWAVALKNYELATKLMNEPYRSPVLTEDSECLTPFATACMTGAPESFVSDLLERSVAVYDAFLKWREVYGSTPKQAAARSEPKQAVDSSSAGADTTNSGGKRADDAISGGEGHLQTAPGDQEVATISVEETPTLALVNTVDSLGNSPLLMVVSRGYLHLAKLLLKYGANLMHQNGRGQSPLHRAVSRGNVDLVEELVRVSEQRNANAKPAHRRWMNLQDYRGDTALFYASMENNEEVGRFLIRHGADKDHRNKEGKQFWEV